VVYAQNSYGFYVQQDMNTQAPNRAMVNGIGWMFDGWYKDDDCTEEWYGVADDTTVENMPTEVYAKFLPFEELSLDF
jgi:hypothetical protein